MHGYTHAKVERLSFYNRILVVLLFALSGLWLGGAAQNKNSAVPSTVRAKSFQLVDAAGRVRAELGTDKEGSSGFFLKDKEGRVRASVIHDDSQTALYIFDDEGTIRVGAAMFAHGGNGLALHGPKSKGAAALYYKNGGSLTFYDESGKVIDRVPSN